MFLCIGQECMTLTEQEFDDVMSVNVKGNFFCCQASAGIMKENGGGRIILIGSVHHKGAVWGRSMYAASKGAIASLVHNMAFELAQHGIRVNQLVAGAVRTERWEGISPEEEARRRRNWPTGMEATGEEIAEGVFYLASDAARNITGTALTLDSGISACLLNYNGGEH